MTEKITKEDIFELNQYSGNQGSVAIALGLLAIAQAITELCKVVREQDDITLEKRDA